MDATVIQTFGPPAESLAVQLEPVPEAGPGEVLVEVHAAGVNPFDAADTLGFVAALTPPPPMITGLDYAGVVVSDGDHVVQEVWGSATELSLKRPGTHARFVVLPETWLSRKPERLTMAEAAAVGHPYLTAWEAVIERGQLTPGETLLITGGSGLVGQAATAIARWRGAMPIVASRRRPDGVEHSSTPARTTCTTRCSSSPTGAVPTWHSTRSVASCSSPFSAASVSAAG